MEINQVYAGDAYKVLKAEVPAGGKMPEHYATSDAFVVIVKGEAELTFSDSKRAVKAGMGFSIPCRKPHTMEIKEDFEAYITIGPDAGIELVTDKAKGSKEQQAASA